METADQEQKKLGLRTAIFGKIFTSDIKNKWAEAIIFQDDIIIYVGDKTKAEEYLTESTKRVQMNPEHILLPGFIDSHIHFLHGGLQKTSQCIEACCSLKELQVQIEEFLSKTPDATWVEASGLVDTLFPEKLPHRRHLDAICPEKPMAFKKFDCHSFLVNTKALEVANITKDTPNPPNGVIEKDANGELTGMLYEDAMNLVRCHFPETSPTDYMKALEASAKLFLEEGITCYTDALVEAHRCQYFEKLYAEQSENLPRGFLCLGWDKNFEQAIDENENGFNLYEMAKIKPQERLKIQTVKFFIDGILESKTALVHEPYLGDENNFGLQIYEENHLKNYVTKLHRKGIQTHYHAIGDKAVTMALDAVEHAKAETQSEDLDDPRHYIAHLQLVRESDYPRFAELNVGLSFSPAWLWDEPISKQLRFAIIDRKRAESVCYPVKSIMKQGGRVSFGSDWPVTTPCPLEGIEICVTRKRHGNKNKEEEGWHEVECLTVEEAVLCYTINSAYLCHQEKMVGSLEVGKKADFVVLDKNIFTCEHYEIHEAKVAVTVIDGKTLFGSLEKS